MRPNRYIILVSILFGAFGAWFSADAVGQYLNVSRSFASVTAQYVDDSFTWLDSDYEQARAEFVVTNDYENDARLQHFGMNLLFDGNFAGARYEPWEAIDIPAGESVTIEVPFLVSISERRPEGGEAELSVRGQLQLEFEGIERTMTVPARGTIGQVSYEGQDDG